MANELQFLNVGEKKSIDAKYNLFRFQDHLLDWISKSAQEFQMGEYSTSFDSLTVVYIDSIGFLNKKEQEEMQKDFDSLSAKNSQYLNYRISWSRKGGSFNPPVDMYKDLLDFRRKLMTYLTKHQLLIPQVKKGDAGAASEM